MNSLITFNDTTNQLQLNELAELRKWIIQSAQLEGFNVGELHFIFKSDEELHQINLEFLAHDTLTDIITFDYTQDQSIAGEIYISLDRVIENAKSFKQDLQIEIRRILIHGVLHLLGYKDKNAKDKALMTSKEDYYLSLLTN